MKGSYILLIKLEKDKEIQIGKLGNIAFKKGYYVYIGSALNGLKQRINRHFRQNKKYHWHIDFLLRFGKIEDVFYKENTVREECILVKKFEQKLQPIHNFGCSDCKCKSHLFYGSKNQMINLIDSLDFINYL